MSIKLFDDFNNLSNILVGYYGDAGPDDTRETITNELINSCTKSTIEKIIKEMNEFLTTTKALPGEKSRFVEEAGIVADTDAEAEKIIRELRDLLGKKRQ